MNQHKTDRRTFLTKAAAAGAAVAAAGSVPALAEAATRPARKPSAPTTLTWGWWSNTPIKDNAYRAWLQEFEAQHPTIKLKAEILPWANYWDKLRTTLAGGNAYDIVGLSTSGPAVAQYMQNGLFVDLSALSGYRSVVSALQSTPVNLYNWNGKQYGLPVGIALWVMGYNKTLFKKAGVPYPDPVKPMTFAQLKAVARKLTVTQNGKVVQYGIAPAAILDWNELVEMEGGQVYNRAVNPTQMLLDTPAGIQGLTDYQSMFKEGITPPIDHIADWGGGYIGSLQTGKVAIAALGPWDFGTIVGGNLPYGIAPSPMIKKAAMDSGANGYGIYKGSQNVEAAWEFIKWATQSENQLKFATFSDIPANKSAFDRIASVIKPSNFTQTLLSQDKAYRPAALAVNPQLATTLTNITTDLALGHLTPLNAAVEIRRQGNALLNGH